LFLGKTPGIGATAPSSQYETTQNSGQTVSHGECKDALHAAFNRAIAETREVAPGVRIPNAASPLTLHSLIKTIT
jgi:hypothetical protein